MHPSWQKKAQVKPIDIDLYLSDDTNKLESADFELRPFGFSTVYGEVFEFNIQRTFDRLDEDFEIFEDVIVKRRTQKINKIKENIKK